jgi:FkbM family methyltransferase
MSKIVEVGDFAIARLVRRTFLCTREYGAADAFRRAAWKVCRARFDRLKKRRSSLSAPPVIRFLDQEFELHPSRLGVSAELALYGVHEPMATRVYLETLSPGDHVIDVGSNIGYWLLQAARRIGESGRMLAFEPVPGPREILQRNIQRSGISNVELSPWAIGRENGNAELYESQVPNWGSLVRHDGLLQTRTLPVEIRKLDDVVKESAGFRPTMLRMDVEGAELMVLEGAQNLLGKYKPCLFIEFHPFLIGWRAIRRTLSGLKNLGYISGTLIQREWDQPWIGKWMRERRRWRGPMDVLIQRCESSQDSLSESTLTMVLTAGGTEMSSTTAS